MAACLFFSFTVYFPYQVSGEEFDFDLSALIKKNKLMRRRSSCATHGYSPIVANNSRHFEQNLNTAFEGETFPANYKRFLKGMKGLFRKGDSALHHVLKYL